MADETVPAPTGAKEITPTGDGKTAPTGDGGIELSESSAKASQLHADLSERVNEARWRYYVLDAPTMSDGEFDALLRQLMELEDAFPKLRTPDSPTQQVGPPPSTTFTPVEHLQRLMSLDNVFKAECLLASHMNGQPLNAVYGAPLRLRVENQLGYKMVKWIERIEFVSSEKLLGAGEGGKNEDDEYFDLLPNI